MALTRGRVIDPTTLGERARALDVAEARTAPDGKVVPREVVAAHDEAARLLARARWEAKAIVEGAREKAEGARRAAEDDAKKDAAARIAAEHVKLADARAREMAARRDEIVAIARILAERVLGKALELDPSLVVDLARQALAPAVRARRVTLFVHPDDADVLRRRLDELGLEATALEVQIDPALARGSLRADTDLGALDADLPLQLDRLVAALRG